MAALAKYVRNHHNKRMVEPMEPAASIIRMCGGYNKVGKIVGVDRTRVYRWTQPVGPKIQGTGGLIPIKYAQKLIDAKIPGLTPEMFFRNGSP